MNKTRPSRKIVASLLGFLLCSTLTISGLSANLGSARADDTATGCVSAGGGKIDTVSLSQTTDLYRYTSNQISMTGTLPAGACSGDKVTVQVPDQIVLPDVSAPIYATDGTTVIGTMTASSTAHAITFTFNGEVEGKSETTFQGKVWGWVSDDVTPDTSYTLNFGGAAHASVTIHTAECGSACTADSGTLQKIGYIGTSGTGAKRAQADIIVPAQSSGASVTVNDTLTSDGQKFACDGSEIIGVQTATEKDAWGSWIPLTGGDLPYTLVSCTDTGLSLTVAAPAGRTVIVKVAADITDFTRSSMTDEASSELNGVTEHAHAVANLAGGSASGDNTTTPGSTPSTSTSPSATSSPTTSPTASESASASPSKTVSASPAKTANTSASKTPDSSTTPSGNVIDHLAATGADTWPLMAAGVLVAVSLGLLVRRQSDKRQE